MLSDFIGTHCRGKALVHGQFEWSDVPKWLGQFPHDEVHRSSCAAQITVMHARNPV